MKNRQVVERFLAKGSPCSTKNLSWDGEYLRSYYEIIGFHYKGQPVVADYRGKDKISQTTSCHIGLCWKASYLPVDLFEKLLEKIES